MKEIQLTKGYVTLVDDEDFKLLDLLYVWHAHITNGGVYAYGKALVGDTSPVVMHRLILSTPKELSVDHIDGDGLNNQRHNLRVCNDTQNAANRRRLRTYENRRFKGVRQRSMNGRWEAAIGFNYRSHSLGTFDTEIEAAIAYNEAARHFFREFARLNVIPDQLTY